MYMSEDISRKTILVLVVLTVVVSALGTLTVLDTVEQTRLPAIQEAPDATTNVEGRVRLGIAELEPPVTGQVILDIRTS